MIGQLLTGRYLVLKLLGTGGFSETYVARDKYLPHHPLCVVKCLKLSPSSTISPDTARQLFETESRVLDRLGQHHSQIPTLFAHCPEQEPVYHVQEYIDGENLGDWLSQRRRLTSQEAIDLLLSVLPVVDYIHCHQVIHRDIKPSNLIRRQQDGKIVLIDFGAACLLSDSSALGAFEDNNHSVTIGTPGYMPEEQQNDAARFNSDLYALGMTVIHLLTGVHPQHFHDDPISGELDWQCQLRDPVEPSLVMILGRMVQRHGRDRYQSATDVLTALRTHILQKQGLRWLLMQWKESIRPWHLVIVTTALLSFAGGWYLYDRREQWTTLLPHSPSQSSTLRLTLVRDLPMQTGIDRMWIAPDNQFLVTAGTDQSLRLWSLPGGALLKSLSGHRAPITALAMDQESRLLVSGAGDRTVRLWDTASGTLLWQSPPRSHDQAVTAVAISPDGRTIASGSQDGTIHLWDRQTGALVNTLSLPKSTITALTYGADPDHLVSAGSIRAGSDGGVYQIQIWDLRTGQLRRTFSGHRATIVRLQMADPATLVSFGKDHTLVWNISREELMQVCGEDTAQLVTGSLNVHSNYQPMVTVNDDGNIRRWIRTAGHLVASGSSNLGRSRHVALSPDLTFVVSWSPDQRLRVWHLNASDL